MMGLDLRTLHPKHGPSTNPTEEYLRESRRLNYAAPYLAQVELRGPRNKRLPLLHYLEPFRPLLRVA